MEFGIAYVLQCFLLCCCFVTVLCGFKHRVIPACSKTEDVCKFEFDVQYKFSMVHYFNGYASPIVLRNGTLLRRLVYNSEKFVPLTPQELDEVLTVDGAHKLLFSINGEMPGPPIVVYEGQMIEVLVKNSLSNEAFTIHWHGMTQKNTPWMDGVPMVTQCPISPGNSFLYRFKAEPRGTHWYHAHQGTMRTDGLAGPLIVLPREERLDIPEVEDDFILMIQDWNRNISSLESVQIQLSNMHLYINNFDCTNDCFHPTHTADGTLIGVVPFHSGLINGKGHFYPHDSYEPLSPELPIETFKVKPDKYYRFRIINVAMMFTFRFSVDEHLIHVISTDGNDVELETAQSLIISSGESFDILVKTDGNPKRNYYVRAETTEVKSKLNDQIYPGRALAVLRYEDAPEKLPKTTRHKCSKEKVCKVLNCPFQLYPAEANILCKSTADFRSTQEMVSRQAVPLLPFGEKIREDFLNFHFTNKRGRPAMAAINGHTFKSPTCPPQITYDPPARTCFNDCQDHDCAVYCECTHTLKYDQLPLNTAVQMVLVNTDITNGGTNHPIHIHGHHFHVLKIGYPEVDKETGLIVHDTTDIKCAGKNCKSPSWTRDEWAGGDAPGLNLKNPPLKDTVVVPRKGYVVLRFRLDNPGYWFMHCHMKSHQMEGMTLIIKEGRHADQEKPPENFPTCGDFTWPYNQYKEIDNGPTVRLGALSNDSTQNENNKENHSTGPMGYLSQTTVTILIVIICMAGVILMVVFIKNSTQFVQHEGSSIKNCSNGCGTDTEPLLSSRPKVRVNGSMK
ncbi:uncharacterized protein LOC133188761 [Saccostrea echinata]|uniref:uncharacterized protein LOC133188761 n=1 Tax=Saccostrea echinata TaxID=191078 RepID=UPI002A806713|nr:uncharacterized protein LOC133188761 [Saccostrea echinata]